MERAKLKTEQLKAQRMKDRIVKYIQNKEYIYQWELCFHIYENEQWSNPHEKLYNENH